MRGPWTMFRDRQHAGRLLARKLSEYRDNPQVLVLALPRGGVAVAAEVAQALGAPLDVLIVRKLGVPGMEELAMGAIASGGVRLLNESVVQTLEIPTDVIEAVAARELAEVERREQRYRAGAPPLNARERIAIVVDDGLATGATMRAAIAALRRQQPARIVVAVPVASSEALADVRAEADAVVCLSTPILFWGIGQFYEQFSQLTDENVQALLAQSRLPGAARAA